MITMKENAPNAPDFTEPHFTLGQLAKMWHMDRHTLRLWFQNEEGVLKWGTARLNKGRRAPYVSLRVPASVAQRVHLRRTGRDVYPANGY